MDLLSFQSTQSIQSSNESTNFYNGKNKNFDLTNFSKITNPRIVKSRLRWDILFTLGLLCIVLVTDFNCEFGLLLE